MKYQDFKRMLKVEEDFEAVFNQVEQEAREGYVSKTDSQKEVDLLLKNHKLELQGIKQGFKLDAELEKVGSHDVTLLKGLLDLKQLKFGEAGVEGLEEQVKSLRESKPYLFKDETPAPTPTPIFGATPAGNTSQNTSADDETALLNAMLNSSLF